MLLEPQESGGKKENMSKISCFSKSVSLSEIVSSFIPGPANGLEDDCTAQMVGMVVAGFHGSAEVATDETFTVVWDANTKTIQVNDGERLFTFEPQLVPGEELVSIANKAFKLVEVSTK
jgi:hypothetical protein